MPYLSHSQCETISQCPRRWYLQKAEGAPQAPSEALILGAAVHTCLEHAGTAIMEGQTPPTLDDLIDDFADALTIAIADDDPQHMLSVPTLSDMRAKGIAILRAYVEHLQPRYAPTAVEESFTVEIPGAPGWKFTGRIDARVTLSNGTPAILDFKTAAKPWQPGAEDEKPQASAYIWATNQQGSEAEGDRQNSVVFAVFPTEPDGQGGFVCHPQFRVTTRTIDQLAAYSRYLVTTIRQIEQAKRTETFPANTGPLCGWCSVLGSCTSGQQWLADHNRKPAIPMVSRQPQGPLDEHEESEAGA